MHPPYTSNFPDAYNAANSCIVLVVSALLWHQAARSLASRVAMQIALLLGAVAPLLAEFEAGIGFHPGPESFEHTLHLVAAMATIATLLSGRWGVVVWAVAGEIALHYLTGYLTQSSLELLSLHVAWCGLLVGLHHTPALRPSRAMTALSRPHQEDWILFVVATGITALVGAVVLQRRIGDSDEWAYTFQAAVFAKFHAYADAPPCTPAFQNFWVFTYMGKQFSQYTPGWPLFMAPFVWFGAPWLAGSFAFGLLAVGLARLTRRAMALADDGTSAPAVVTAAGVCTALVTSASSTFLINGASRFPHIFELACFVWALEALLHVSTPVPKPTHPERWGALMGVCLAFMLAIRPVDGGGLGVGLFLYFVYALARRRLGFKVVLAIAVPFALLGGLTLVILRLQLGKWFTTGYSLNPMIYPWNKFDIVKPKPEDWRWGFPLAQGSYGWWPASLAAGFAGLASLGRRGRPLNFVLFFSMMPVLVFYACLTQGRDWGYGPRYQMVLLVPMTVGTGIVLARLWATAGAHRAAGSALRAGGPFAVALVAMVVGVVRIAPLVYPFDFAAVTTENRLQRAIDDADVHDALVLAAPGTGAVDPFDLTQNLPLELYPRQDVLIALTRTPGLEECVRANFPGRAVYRASGSQVVTLHREK